MGQDRGGKAGLEERVGHDVKCKSQQSAVRYIKEVFLGNITFVLDLRKIWLISKSGNYILGNEEKRKQ